MSNLHFLNIATFPFICRLRVIILSGIPPSAHKHTTTTYAKTERARHREKRSIEARYKNIMATSVKPPVMIVGIDDSDESFYALEWTLDHFFAPYAPNLPFSILLVYAKPAPTAAIGLTGPGAAEVLSLMEADQKKVAARIMEKAKDLCRSKSVHEVAVKVIEGDARNVLCEAVEKNNASMLVVGNHGYGAFKRAFLGSVSDYCARHAHCSVMIVKKPKTKSQPHP